MRRPLTETVIAYVFRGPELLVFERPSSPEAGLAVPAGPVQPGETPRDAAVRTIREGAGLTVIGVRPLGFIDADSVEDDDREVLERRHFFAMRLHGLAPDRWVHYEPARDEEPPERFEFSWRPAASPQALADGLDALLGRALAA